MLSYQLNYTLNTAYERGTSLTTWLADRIQYSYGQVNKAK